jgi:hypothetical protein
VALDAEQAAPFLRVMSPRPLLPVRDLNRAGSPGDRDVDPVAPEQEPSANRRR